MYPIDKAQDELWILQLCHSYDGPFLDCARQYAALFVGTRYRVCTVYLTGRPSEDVRLGSASDEVIFLNYPSRAMRGLKLIAVRELSRLVSSRSFVACIAHRFKPIYVALLGTALPVIGVHHAFGVYDRFMRRLFIRRFKSRLLLLGVSNAVRDDILQKLPDWPADRIETLYNRIDIEAIQAEQVSPALAREYLGLPQAVWIVGNAGRLHPDKDQATLIRGFAMALPNLPPGSLLAIMGEGRLEAELRQLAHRLGIEESVRFLGQVAKGRRFFKAFDTFVLTSDHEPFGMVLLEAMAAGTPVICSDCGGGREVVEGVGQVFPLGAHARLSELLSQSARKGTAELSDCASRQLLKIREKFSDEAVRRQFQSLMLSVYR